MNKDEILDALREFFTDDENDGAYVMWDEGYEDDVVIDGYFDMTALAEHIERKLREHK